MSGEEDFCVCENYGCTGECCGEGQCTCTPTEWERRVKALDEGGGE